MSTPAFNMSAGISDNDRNIISLFGSSVPAADKPNTVWENGKPQANEQSVSELTKLPKQTDVSLV